MKMKDKCMYVLAIVTMCAPIMLWGQGDPSVDIIPPSPAAQAFMRYGEVPVDHSTGVPKIEVPIYTIESKKLKLPISISYHASGIKVKDIASEVGLGWVFNAGGLVSRTIFGVADENGSDRRTFNTANELMDSVRAASLIWDPAGAILKGLRDMEDFLAHSGRFQNEDPLSDRFFYKLPNGPTGVFSHDYLNGNVIMLPYRPYKINKFISSTAHSGSHIDSLKITDENGTVYIFKTLAPFRQNRTEWYLTKMSSADGTDHIDLFYELQTENQVASIQSHILVGPYEHGITCYPGGNESPELTYSGSPSPIFLAPVLKRVVGTNTIVDFNYVKDREDFAQLFRLADITIRSTDRPQGMLKQVRFIPRYFGASSEEKRLGLDKVAIIYPGNTGEQEYSFSYENRTLPPYPFKMSDSRHYSEDFWGYYNGSNSPNLVPAGFVQELDWSGIYGNRSPDLTGYFAKACMLKEIGYPTGGKTSFQFERHVSGAGGFRIGSIINYDENNEVTGVKTYEYQRAVTRQPRRELFWYVQDKAVTGFKPNGSSTACWSLTSRHFVMSDPILPLEVAPGLPVMYRKVIEYNGTKTNNSGKTEYTYGQPYSPSDYIQSYDEHPREYDGLPRLYHPYHYDKGNYTPELLSKGEYVFDGTAYRPVSKVTNTYTKLYTQAYHTGIKLSRLKEYQSISYFAFGVACGVLPFDCGIAVTEVINEYIRSIAAIDTKAYQEASLLTSTKSYSFDPNDSTKYVAVSTDYTYSETNLGVKEKSVLSGNGDMVATSYQYPSDFSSGGNVYSYMRGLNILSPVIGQTDKVNNTIVETTKTNYKNWGGNVFGPETVTTSRNGQDDTRLRYKYDDHGNLIEASKENDMNTCYLWGYNKALPVAKVQNATHITRSASKNWSGRFHYVGPMNNNQRYPLHGNCSFPQTVNATISRHYMKGNDRYISFTVYVYDSNGSLVRSFSDVMPLAQTDLRVSSQVALPAGQYTVEVAPSYQVGSTYSPEIEVSISGSANVEETVPFYTSFEEEVAGTVTTYRKTGRRSYRGTYTIALPPCPPDNNKYVISYWRRTASSNWELIAQTVEVPSTGGHTMTIGAENMYIDEVRVYPAGAEMTTYTYEPLIGMTSETDPNGETTYYEYDGMNRLWRIKDANGHILQQYEYHYAGQ